MPGTVRGRDSAVRETLAGVNQVCLMHQEKVLRPASCFQTEEEIRVEKTLHIFAGFSAFFFFFKASSVAMFEN